MKRRAATTLSGFDRIIRDTLAELDRGQDVKAALPSMESLRRTLERVRYPSDDSANKIPPKFTNPNTIFDSRGESFQFIPQHIHI